jgi:hypothetical protein
MLVQIHGDADCGMAHRLGNHLGLNTLPQRQSCIRMPQAMKRQRGQAKPFDEAGEILGYLVGYQRSAAGMDEHESGVLPKRPKLNLR